MLDRFIRIVPAALMFGAVLMGCDQRSPAPAAAPSNPPPTSSTPRAGGTAAPDNTARNERDRSGATTTPPDQGESETDRRITADIRKAVMDHQGLSVNAQNCKIITRGSTVTLRGPVKNQDEKTWLESVAKGTAGVSTVINELEITG
jgi:hyperosmotically inducible protein